jgi:hypothetical protein
MSKSYLGFIESAKSHIDEILSLLGEDPLHMSVEELSVLLDNLDVNGGRFALLDVWSKFFYDYVQVIARMGHEAYHDTNDEVFVDQKRLKEVLVTLTQQFVEHHDVPYVEKNLLPLLKDSFSLLDQKDLDADNLQRQLFKLDQSFNRVKSDVILEVGRLIEQLQKNSSCIDDMSLKKSKVITFDKESVNDDDLNALRSFL